MNKQPYYVRCTNCGRRFDANRIAPINRSSVFTERGCLCSNCRQRLAEERINEINLAEASGEISSDKAYMLKHRKNYSKLLAGGIILIGALLALISAIKNHSSILVLCIIFIFVGIGLIAWNVIELKKYHQAFVKEKNRTILEKEESQGDTICIHCGASSRGNICPFCGMDKHKGTI